MATESQIEGFRYAKQTKLIDNMMLLLAEYGHWKLHIKKDPKPFSQGEAETFLGLNRRSLGPRAVNLVRAGCLLQEAENTHGTYFEYPKGFDVTFKPPAKKGAKPEKSYKGFFEELWVTTTYTSPTPVQHYRLGKAPVKKVPNHPPTLVIVWLGPEKPSIITPRRYTLSDIFEEWAKIYAEKLAKGDSHDSLIANHFWLDTKKKTNLGYLPPPDVDQPGQPE